MTPQLDPQQSESNRNRVADSAHLTPEQFGELLAGPAPAASPEVALVETHLLACERCSTELDGLRQSISLFRDATSAYAEGQMLHRPRWVPPARPAPASRLIPVYWAAAAAAMLLTALLPIQVLRHPDHSTQPVAAVSSSTDNTQSDEALLEDVDRAISTPVPTPMQALADPTADASNGNSTSTSTQRK